VTTHRENFPKLTLSKKNKEDRFSYLNWTVTNGKYVKLSVKLNKNTDVLNKLNDILLLPIEFETFSKIIHSTEDILTGKITDAHIEIFDNEWIDGKRNQNLVKRGSIKLGLTKHERIYIEICEVGKSKTAFLLEMPNRYSKYILVDNKQDPFSKQYTRTYIDLLKLSLIDHYKYTSEIN
jgi:hypothetical protein